MHDHYSQINLAEIEDAAPANGFGDRWQARVAPEVARAFEAGSDGLEFLASGPHHPADGEPAYDDWIK